MLAFAVQFVMQDGTTAPRCEAAAQRNSSHRSDGEMSPDPAGHTTGARARAAVTLALLVSGLVLLLAPGAGAQVGRSVAVTTIDGLITPVVADHLTDTVERAAEQGHAALVVRLDTPGGLLESTRTIVQTFLNAPLPIVVHVAPSGADAGSAGTFITYAAHIAAMAPATTIGAATPVDQEGTQASDKIVENAAAFASAIAEERDRDVDFATAAVREGRSITAAVALDVGAIDVIAGTTTELLEAIDGRDVEVRDATVTLDTAGAQVVELDMTGVRRILHLLADPNLAFIFLSLGTLAILYEIANPGLGLGGVVGVVSIVLAMFALSVLPVNYAGAALLVLAAAMFIAELFMPGIGVGAGGGTIALLLGGLFLFQSGTGVGVDWWVLIPTAVVGFGLTVLAAVMVARTRGRVSKAGSDDLIGLTVTVENASAGRPRSRVGGSLWRVRPEDPDLPLRDGDRVTITARDNLDLIVVPADHPVPATGHDGDDTSP